MTLLAVSFSMTTDVWYVDSEDRDRWCFGSRHDSSNPLKFEIMPVSSLRAGDYVSGAGWFSWPSNPDGSPADGWEKVYRNMNYLMVYTVKSVVDGLSHQVLES